MRRDSEGTDRISLFEHDRRLMALDVAPELPKPNDGTTKHVLKEKGNRWPKVGGNFSDLLRANSMVIQFSPKEQVTRAWIKSLYLMAGCARHGEAWTMPWAPKVRAYLRGTIPLDDSIGWINPDFKAPAMDPPTPPSGLVMRCATERRLDVFISIWGSHACFFGLPKAELPANAVLSIQWAELGPFVYGKPART